MMLGIEWTVWGHAPHFFKSHKAAESSIVQKLWFCLLFHLGAPYVNKHCYFLKKISIVIG
jgi:hypothetical protein